MSKLLINKLRSILKPRTSCEPISEDADGIHHSRQEPSGPASSKPKDPFSWIEYGIFFLLGIAMLWAWNMFLAAAPYLQYRFRSSKPILSSFQATELSASTVANLGSMLVLARLQANASYPKRIVLSLLINVGTFALLAISTKLFLGASAGVYFAFIVLMVLSSSLATGFMQNGTFAYVVRFGRSEYMQAIMFGQAVAGVLPPIVQMVTVLSAEHDEPDYHDVAPDGAGTQNSSSALYYFLTAMIVSAVALVAFLYLALYHTRGTRRGARPATTNRVTERNPLAHAEDDDDDERDEDPLSHSRASLEDGPRESVPLRVLARKLLFPASAVFITFGVTMVFPVFTSLIVTTNPTPPPFLKDASFIPLALLIWNAGDLLGRLVPLAPALSLAHRPKILLLLSLARFVFIPLYFICNIQPAETEARHAVFGLVMPDLFYFAIVQFPFGLSNGYLGTCCMTGAADCVDKSEGEAAGGFMALSLVGGLAVGSICSFFISVPTS